jgi:hypothetical protein
MMATASEKRQCAERELAMRRRVYPRWIEAKRMSQGKADQEIALMQEIAADYAKLEAGERLI